MKISTKARYGIRAMAELASPQSDSTLSVKEIGARQNISIKYLSQIMSTLKTAGLVRSVCGMHGGFSLSKPPQRITLMDVFQALEGSTTPVECVDNPKICPMTDKCLTKQIWSEIKHSIDKILVHTTLLDLVERKKQN